MPTKVPLAGRVTDAAGGAGCMSANAACLLRAEYVDTAGVNFTRKLHQACALAGTFYAEAVGDAKLGAMRAANEEVGAFSPFDLHRAFSRIERYREVLAQVAVR